MNNRKAIALAGLGAVCVGAAFLFFKNAAKSPASRFGARKFAWMSHEARDLKRFDQPSEAMAYYVNRRMGPIATRNPAMVNRLQNGPLDPRLYLTAIAAARSTPGIVSGTGAIVANAAPGATLGSWSPIGPNNQGGRTRQILIDPTNPNIMFAAAVGGGVWKSTNGGTSWTVLTDLLIPNIAVTALAFQPNNTQVLYAGTGEGYFNGDAIRGAGIFISPDGGTTWTQLASTNNTNFQYVQDIVVSPRNTQRIYATTRAGLYRSNDGGATWTQLVNGAAVNGCMDIAMQVNRITGFVFASCGTFAQATIYRALDTNTSSFAAVFTTANMGRTSLAIAPSNEDYIYAMAASIGAGNYEDGLLGVFRSTSNGGSGTWTTQVSNTNPNVLNTLLLTNPIFNYTSCVGGSFFFNQGWYDNVIAVDPLDPNRVWVGGIDLFRSDDGGANWGLASYWWSQGVPGFGASYAHADNHAITFHPNYNGTSNKIMYVGSDGGIFRTNDARANTGTTEANVCTVPAAGAVTWTELNNGYVTTQFYQGTSYPDGNSYMGGTQDNGTWYGTTSSLAWAQINGGDGGYTALDTLGTPLIADDVVFNEFTGLSLIKSTTGPFGIFNDAVAGISDPFFGFIAPYIMNTSNRQQMWMGGGFIWRSTNQAASWVQASAITPGVGSVSGVAASPTDPNKVIVGMSDGYILFNTAALSATSATNWAFTRPRTTGITSLAFDPNNSNVAWATYATFSGQSVYQSTNSGATWTLKPGTGVNVLPLVPAFCVVVDPADSNRIYVATDIGVFTSIDGGSNWFKEITNFANVSTEWLAISTTGGRKLTAFTHGRGAWQTAIAP
jgi:photosystem II stability/assembly factor-like uncharacterized protein